MINRPLDDPAYATEYFPRRPRPASARAETARLKKKRADMNARAILYGQEMDSQGL